MKVSSNQNISKRNQNVKSARQQSAFSERVKGMFPGGGKKRIGEAELFSALINERLGAKKG